MCSIGSFSRTYPVASCTMNGCCQNVSSFYSGRETVEEEDIINGIVYTFRPGAITQGNIFGTWEDVYAAVRAFSGDCIILFDDSLMPFGEPIVIPPGDWNLTRVGFLAPIASIHSPPVIYTLLNISDGATLNGLYAIDGPLFVNYLGTTQPAITLHTTQESKQSSFALKNGVRLKCSGTQPFIDLGGYFAELIMLFGSVVYGTVPTDSVSTVEPIRCSASTNGNIIVMTGYSVLNDNSVSGTFAAIIRANPGTSITVPLVQTNLASSFIQYGYTSADTYQRSVAPTVNDDTNIGYKVSDFWLNTTGPTGYIAYDVSAGAAVWHQIP